MSDYKYKVKREISPGAEADWPLFYPSTLVYITCKGFEGNPNIFPATGFSRLSKDPLTFGVSVSIDHYDERYWERFSYRLMLEGMEYVINIPTEDMADKTLATGRTSMWEVPDKFAHAGLTPEKAFKVNVPLIKECPVSIECVTTQIMNLGSHDWFVGEAVSIDVDEDVLEGKKKLLWDELPFYKGENK